MTDFLLDVLYTDNHLIAVTKPSGILTQGDHSNDISLMEQTREWIRYNNKKPGNVFLGLVHRLDRNVSGIVLFARTSKAASRLSKQFREGLPKKIYRAIVLGIPDPPSDKLIHYLRKEKTLKTTVFPRETSSSKRAELSYKIIESFKKTSLIELNLYTGRFHQIRSQMAFIGHPIMGDVKYGNKVFPDKKIALYSSMLAFNHPISGEIITLNIPEPKDWEIFKI